VKRTTRRDIKAYLDKFACDIIDKFEASDLDPRESRALATRDGQGRIKPFHEAMLPEGVMRIAGFERSFSSSLGSTFEETGYLIATDKFANAERQYRVKGTISAGAVAEIQTIVEGARSGFIRGRFLEFVDRVLAADDGPRHNITEIADLRVLDADDNETFFEIKSPKPNKGQCLEATQRLLRMHAIRRKGSPRVRAFYAMAYNPYGDDPTCYDYGIANNYLDMDNQVILGSEFWEYLGGPGTYEALLNVYRQVGKEKGPDMIDRLALGY
jgi:hypothetical protein